jgi:hypothetical protein
MNSSADKLIKDWIVTVRAGIARSVQRLAMSWTAEGSEDSSNKGKIFLFFMLSRLVLGPTQPSV